MRLEHRLGAELADLADAEDVGAHRPRVGIALAGGRGDVADAELGEAGHVGTLRRAPHRAAVTEADAVTLVDEVEMRIELHDVDRPVLGKGGDGRDGDRMIAAERDRQRARGEDLAHRRLDIGVAADRIGVDDVGVADVDDAGRLGGEVDDVVLVVVGAGMAEGEQGRGIADGARTEAGAGAPLRAEVEGRAEDGDVGLDPVPVEAERILAEGRNPDEGEIEPAGLVSVGHDQVDRRAE